MPFNALKWNAWKDQRRSGRARRQRLRESDNGFGHSDPSESGAQDLTKRPRFLRAICQGIYIRFLLPKVGSGAFSTDFIGTDLRPQARLCWWSFLLVDIFTESGPHTNLPVSILNENSNWSYLPDVSRVVSPTERWIVSDSLVPISFPQLIPLHPYTTMFLQSKVDSIGTRHPSSEDYVSQWNSIRGSNPHARARSSWWLSLPRAQSPHSREGKRIGHRRTVALLLLL